MTILTAFSINAQRKTVQPVKVELGNKLVAIKGKIFNEIIYNFTSNQTKYVAYQYFDKLKKALIITEVTYETDNNKTIATNIEIYNCPLSRIDKQNSYNLKMEDEILAGGKYWRLTLISKGQGADNLYFQKQTITENSAKTIAVNNLTINLIDKIKADKWLAEFIKWIFDTNFQKISL